MTERQSLYRFSDDDWSRIEALMRNLPSFDEVEETARSEIEAACHHLLHAKKFYTSRAPDPKVSIDDFRKAEALSDSLRLHLYNMLRRRNEDLLEFEVLKDPYLPMEYFQDGYQDRDETTGLKIVDFIELLLSLKENFRWIREHIEGDRAEFDLKTPGPRTIYDERVFFDSLMKVWVGSGGQSSIGINLKRDGDDQFYGFTLDFLNLIFRTLAGNVDASKLQFRIPQPATLRAWCDDIRKASK